jgi:hypothetical protein
MMTFPSRIFPSIPRVFGNKLVSAKFGDSVTELNSVTFGLKSSFFVKADPASQFHCFFFIKTIAISCVKQISDPQAWNQ